MNELSVYDQAYLRVKETTSALYARHDEEIKSSLSYRECIKAKVFCQTLKELLKSNKLKEFFDEERKENILKILGYVRFNTELSREHLNMINECNYLICSTPGGRGVRAFYKDEYNERYRDIVPAFSSLFPSNIHLIENQKRNIDESIKLDFEIIKFLLKQDSPLSASDDKLIFPIGFFINTLNIVTKEAPTLFNCFSFKDRALNVLRTTSETSLDSEIIEKGEKRLVLTRTRRVLKKVESL